MKKSTLFIASLILTAIFSTNIIAQQYTKLSDFPEHVKKTKPFKRFEWFYQQRAYPYDTVPGVYANKVCYDEIRKIKKNKNHNNKLITWYPKGPVGVEGTSYYSNFGMVSGRVRAIAVHPNDPLTVYIGAASGGIWKTTDGGDTWQDVGKDLESITYGAIAIDPNNPEVIYAGAGEATFAVLTSYRGGNGLFKSTDGGATWTQITDGFGVHTHFSDIVVCPSNSNVLFASLARGNFNLGTNLPNDGIWKSTDAGEHWEMCLNKNCAFDLLLHPNDTSTILACIGGDYTYSGFYRSFDSGETWEVSNDGLPVSYTISRMHIDLSTSAPDKIYAVVYDWSSAGQWAGITRVFKSDNSGDSWYQVSDGVNLGGNWGSGWYDQGYNTLCLAVDPLDPDHVILGNIELHETTDGENFSPVRSPGGNTAHYSIAHHDYQALAFAPSDPNYFYICCDGGVYCSTDGCTTAQSKSYGLETFQFYRIGSHPTDPNKIIGGLQDNGTVLTEDGGNSWTMVEAGDGMVCFFDYENPEIAYASHQNGQFRISDDGGQTFGNFGNVDGAWVTPFFIHPTGHDTLYSANNDIYRYPHNTYPLYTWQKITTDLSPYLINAFVQSHINPGNMILAGTYYSNPPQTQIIVMVSTDGGYTWINVTGNIPGGLNWISQVVTHPDQENTMYIVRCGFSEANKIYKTTDLGETWTNVSGNLPDIPCNDLFIDPENTNHYYVGTDLGVYFSENEGESWEYAGDGMPLVPILDFDYVKIENTRYLRVGTFGRSIYETIDFVTDIKKNELLSQGTILAIPNPFTTTTTFEYELQRSSIVQIILYNQLGEKVMVLLNKYQSKGKHEITIDLSDLKPGVYFCTLKTNEGIQTKKLIKVE